MISNNSDNNSQIIEKYIKILILIFNYKKGDYCRFEFMIENNDKHKKGR